MLLLIGLIHLIVIVARLLAGEEGGLEVGGGVVRLWDGRGAAT